MIGNKSAPPYDYKSWFELAIEIADGKIEGVDIDNDSLKITSYPPSPNKVFKTRFGEHPIHNHKPSIYTVQEVKAKAFQEIIQILPKNRDELYELYKIALCSLPRYPSPNELVSFLEQLLETYPQDKL